MSAHAIRDVIAAQLYGLPVHNDNPPASPLKNDAIGPGTDLQCTVEIGTGKGCTGAKQISWAVLDNVHHGLSASVGTGELEPMSEFWVSNEEFKRFLPLGGANCPPVVQVQGGLAIHMQAICDKSAFRDCMKTR